MRSKFKNKIVFYDDKYYKNSKTKSPYLFVLDVEKEYRPKLTGSDRLVVSYIDLHGNQDKIKTTPYYLYQRMEILDIEKLRHLPRDFIKGVFK
jgi:hypothetical protein